MHASLIISLLPFALAAPLVQPRDSQLIPGQFIVKFKSGVSTDKYNEAKSLLQNEPKHEYGFESFKAFAGEISDSNVKKLQGLDGVEFVQQDSIVTINTIVTEAGATWGLGRISHTDTNSTDYVYDDSAGEGTCSYIIDTGILVTHPEFEGRATWLKNFAGDGSDTDGAGHGTHTAGTVGSKTYGVAKKTQLFAVKVLDASGSGTYSNVIAGIDFVAQDAKTRNCPKGAVANMSLGGGKNDAVNAAVADAVASGVFFSLSAGNSNADAANQSPASEPSACTVAASDINNAKASFSNFGAVVDIWAPGVQVLSTWNNGGTNTISGTSMSAPHITGLGAYLLSLESISTAQLCARIQELAQKDKLTGVPAGTVNLLAYNGAGATK